MASSFGKAGPGPAASVSRKRPMLLSILGLLGAAMLWFAVSKIHYAADFSIASYTDYYWPRRFGLLVHFIGGAVAISAGLVQLWLGLTGQTGALHRTLGRIYVGAVVFGSVGGGYMWLTIPGHFAYKTGLAGLDLAWIVTTGMAFYAIKRRDIAQHRAWMLRSYTVTFAFVTFRLIERWVGPLVPTPDDPVATEFDAMLAWACWAFPLLVAEVFIQLHAIRARLRHA